MRSTESDERAGRSGESTLATPHLFDSELERRDSPALRVCTRGLGSA